MIQLVYKAVRMSLRPNLALFLILIFFRMLLRGFKSGEHAHQRISTIPNLSQGCVEINGESWGELETSVSLFQWPRPRGHNSDIVGL